MFAQSGINLKSRYYQKIIDLLIKSYNFCKTAYCSDLRYLKLKKIREKAQKKLKKTHTVDDYTVAFSRDKAENKIGKPQVCCSLGDSSKQNRTLNIISILEVELNAEKTSSFKIKAKKLRILRGKLKMIKRLFEPPFYGTF